MAKRHKWVGQIFDSAPPVVYSVIKSANKVLQAG